MKFNSVLSLISLLAISVTKASRSDFYGANDYRPELFKLLDDEIGVMNITMEATVWETMKNKTRLAPWDAGAKGEDYGTEEATMTFSVGGNTDNYSSSDFRIELGGVGSRNFAKPGYNIKMLNGDLHEVKHLRLRGNVRDATTIREKLSADYFYKMGLYTTSANYVYLNINEEFVGLFIITDKVKKQMIKRYFGEKDTKNLYECKKENSRFEDNKIVENCLNTNDKVVNETADIQKFVDTVMSAKTAADLEEILDVDTFMKGLAFEYLTLAWDHFLILGHNYFWYKRPDGKWQTIYSDFDETWGQDLFKETYVKEGNKYMDKMYFLTHEGYINYPNFSVREMDLGHYIVKVLIYDDETRWRRILADAVKTIFNPTFLNKRIDDIVELIRPGIIRDREVDPVTGLAPGRYNTLGFNPSWTIKHFDENIDKVTWMSNIGQSRGLGVKYLIEKRFNYVCHTYGIDPVTLELIEPRPVVSFWPMIKKNKDEYYERYESELFYVSATHIEKEEYNQEEYNLNAVENCCRPRTYEYGLTIYEKEGDQYITPPEVTTTTTTTITSTTIVPTPTSTTSTTPTTTPIETECWSDSLGYPCCQNTCTVYDVDESGSWGYENNEWCGIVESQCNNDCWATRFGYKCCSGCEVYDTDANGQWGYENDEWCGIITENC